jgi:hypothetical protein
MRYVIATQQPKALDAHPRVGSLGKRAEAIAHGRMPRADEPSGFVHADRSIPPWFQLGSAKLGHGCSRCRAGRASLMEMLGRQAMGSVRPMSRLVSARCANYSK